MVEEKKVEKQQELVIVRRDVTPEKLYEEETIQRIAESATTKIASKDPEILPIPEPTTPAKLVLPIFESVIKPPLLLQSKPSLLDP